MRKRKVLVPEQQGKEAKITFLVYTYNEARGQGPFSGIVDHSLSHPLDAILLLSSVRT